MDLVETNKTWNSGFRRLDQSGGTQFFQRTSHLGPFGWICIAIILAVETMCLFLISSTLIFIWSKRVEFKKVVRRVVDHLLGIRARGNTSSDSTSSGTQEVKESSTRTTDSETFFSAQYSEFDQDKKLGFSLVTRIASPLGTSCFCCKIRGVLSAICGSKFGTGDCFIKASGSSTTAFKFHEETEKLITEDGEGSETVVLHSSKRCSCKL